MRRCKFNFYYNHFYFTEVEQFGSSLDSFSKGHRFKSCPLNLLVVFTFKLEKVNYYINLNFIVNHPVLQTIECFEVTIAENKTLDLLNIIKQTYKCNFEILMESPLE